MKKWSEKRHKITLPTHPPKKTAMYPAEVHLFMRSKLITVTLFLLCACSSGTSGTPAGMDGNIMYGQGDMEFVLDNIAVFRTRTELVRPDREAVRYLQDLRERVTILVFMGSWCVDAQMHVPVLFKALQQADNKRITVRVIGLDRRKKDRDGLSETYGIELTPTFVVEYRGREIGRIIEVPSRDAASDVVSILRRTLGG